MENIYISIPRNKVIHIKSSEHFVFNTFLANAYVPGIALLSEPQKAEVIIEHVQSREKKLLISPNHLTIYDEWNQEFPLDFYHLLYSVARTRFFEQGFYSVHAALARGILIVGHSGVGKTTVVLRLVSDYGFSVFSGNKTLISLEGGAMNSIAGTRSITALQKDKDRYLDIVGESIQYHDRIAFALNRYDLPGAIRAIVFIRLNDGVEENALLSTTSVTHRLYPYFLDTVNADTIMCDGADVYVGIPPTGIQERLALGLKGVLPNVPGYSISGSIDFVCNSISKL